MKLRFHLDENVAQSVADALRRRNVPVATAEELGLLSASDEVHLEHARENNRVLVTHDADFLRLHSQGVGPAGIAFCEQGKRTVGEMVAALMLLYELVDAEEMTGRVEFL